MMDSIFKRIILYAGLLLLLVFFADKIKQHRHPRPKLDNSYSLPDEVKAVKYQGLYKCEIQRMTVTQVVSPSLEVKGSNYLKAFKSQILLRKNSQNFWVYLITATEDPWVPQTQLATATDCTPATEAEIKQWEAKDTAKLCIGMWYWDQERHYISRQCGDFLEDQAYINFDFHH